MTLTSLLPFKERMASLILEWKALLNRSQRELIDVLVIQVQMQKRCTVHYIPKVDLHVAIDISENKEAIRKCVCQHGTFVRRHVMSISSC